MAAFRRGVHRMVMRAESGHCGTIIEIAAAPAWKTAKFPVDLPENSARFGKT
jgi:hypothetical protein